MNESVPLKKPKLEGEEYLQLRKRLKELKKLKKVIPQVILSDIGTKASLHTADDKRSPVFLNDIQHLILYSLLGQDSPYPSLRLGKFNQANRVTNTVVLIIEGLTAENYNSNSSIFTNLNSHFNHKVEFISPLSYGGSITEELSAVPINKSQKHKLNSEYGSLNTAAKFSNDLVRLFKPVFPVNIDQQISRTFIGTLPESDTFPRTQLLLSSWQLIEENFPVPLQQGNNKIFSNYVPTKDKYKEVTAKSPMFGLDCEMCKTTTYQLELTRISLIDEKLKTVYESFVKPDNKIIDYLTRYSGITEETLADVTTKLSDVQNVLRKILPSDAILVGQGLSSDLNALKMFHPYIIDTSVIYNLSGMRCYKTKLKILSKMFLNMEIQNSKSGHCSLEDSIAAMKLVQLKLKKSITFGDEVFQSTNGYHCNNLKMDNNLQEIEFIPKAKVFCASIFTQVLKDTERTACLVGNSTIVDEYTKFLNSLSLNVMDDENFEKDDHIRLVFVDKNKEAVRKTSDIVSDHRFSICHLQLHEKNIDCNKDMVKDFKNVNKWIGKIWTKLPYNSFACVLFAGKEENKKNGACFFGVKKNL